jgi:hypothetical protein
MDIKPSDPPDTILTLEQMLKQVRDVLYSSSGVPDPTWRVANVLACVINILIDDRRKVEERQTTSMDWMWCYENPKEAAAEIERLQAKIKEINLLFVKECRKQ